MDGTAVRLERKRASIGAVLEWKDSAATPSPGGAVLDGPSGVVVALVSATGVVDDDGDIIEPGAYTKTLARRRPKIVWHHDLKTPVGRTLEIEELLPGDPRLPKTTRDGHAWPAEAGALIVTKQYNLRTKRGRETYEDVLFYSESGEQEYSIGYAVPPGMSRRGRDGVRRIKEVDLYEISPVLFGANGLSGTLAVKNATPGGDHDSSGDPGGWLDETEGPAQDPAVPHAFMPAPSAATSALPAVCVVCRQPANALIHAAADDGREMERKCFNGDGGLGASIHPAGSWEERRDMLRDALHNFLTDPDPDPVDAPPAAAGGPAGQGAVTYPLDDTDQGTDAPRWVSVEINGTWPDRVIATRYGINPTGAAPLVESYEIPYEIIDDTGEIELGEPEPVKLTITPIPTDLPGLEDPDEDGEMVSPLPGMLEEAAATAKALYGLTPDLETKAGRVLSGLNARRLRAAVEQLIAVLYAAGVPITRPVDDDARVDDPDVDDEVDAAGADLAMAVAGDQVSTAPSARTHRKQLLDPAAYAASLRTFLDVHS
ncbi:hypothetical protein E1264_38645 [Actinomadura sp. KC216]|uniref:HK97 family phage prohead protease n=1 Tax=Actinomadura sp. KC216 TaxID=2530370 RepID=UPI0010454014|nr:hypothetical protein [Actinomadura sp. KC216]TDB76374.1 hypothetical protein E1264_38645 [Actinomadura sp. KC216]